MSGSGTGAVWDWNACEDSAGYSPPLALSSHLAKHSMIFLTIIRNGISALRVVVVYTRDGAVVIKGGGAAAVKIVGGESVQSGAGGLVGWWTDGLVDWWTGGPVGRWAGGPVGWPS